MVAMALNGVDVHDRTGIYLTLMVGFFEPAQVRGTDTIVPSLDGRIPRLRVPDTRRIVLDGEVLGDDAADFFANIQSLMSLIDPQSLVTLTLDDGYMGGGGDSIECRAVNWICSDVMEDVQWQHWNIEFEAVTPNWS